MHVIKIVIIVLLFFCSPAWAATYYIDYNAADDAANGTTTATPWKRAPGMVGCAGNCASYSHTAGDIFVFKGGVTWAAATLPLTIGNSGTAGNIDTYMGGQRCGQSGSASCNGGATWGTGYPVFDGNMTLGASNSGIYASGKSYLLIDGIKILNVGDDATGSGDAIMMFTGSSIEIKNCWLQPEGVEAFGYDNVAGAQSKIYFHHNHISRAGRVAIYSDLATTVDDVRVYNNVFEGSGNTQLRTYHLDGFMFGMPTPTCSGSAAAVTNILFYNNYFYGDWGQGATAQFYSNGWTSGVKIYNNVFAIENTTASQGFSLSPGFVDFGCHDANIEIYNNTFSSDSLHSYVGGIALGGKEGIAIAGPVTGTTIKIKNNIFSNTLIDIALDTSTGITYDIDYNLHNPGTDNWGDVIYYVAAQCSTLSCAQGLGFEANSPALADPKFVTLPNGTLGSGNFHLQSDSPARTGGTNLGAPYTTDLDGVVGTARIGAYEYVAGGGATGSSLSGGRGAGARW